VTAFLVGKPVGRRQLGEYGILWGNNFKIVLETLVGGCGRLTFSEIGSNDGLL
jgi:hypothetical protein